MGITLVVLVTDLVALIVLVVLDPRYWGARENPPPNRA